jgi:hypothetical protein
MFESFSSESSHDAEQSLLMPANFRSVVLDFITDLNTTFPEYSFLWKRWLSPSDRDLVELFEHFTRVFPERFFDILYQNDDMFKTDSIMNTQFLPNVDFRILFHCPGVTETTRSAIWKYLQLILVTILSSVKDKMGFGETANLFEGVDETELQSKLSETIDSIGDFFKHLTGERGHAETDADASADTSADMDMDMDPEAMAKMAEETQKLFEDMMRDNPFASSTTDDEEEAKETHTFESGHQMPNAEDLHEHLRGLFDGKIGSLAKELAEEISGDMQSMFGTDGEDIHSTQDVLKKMMKNPKKIMDLMKTIGGKLTDKMKSGDISEAEIMKEASELLGKMKSMGGKGGMNQFGELFKNMAKTMGGDARVNMGALNQFDKKMSMKQRMLNKLDKRRQATTAPPPVQYQLQQTNLPNNYVFRVGEEKQEKSVKPVPLKSDPEVDLDTLAQEIEQTTATKTAPQKKKSNKKKK